MLYTIRVYFDSSFVFIVYCKQYGKINMKPADLLLCCFWSY